MEQDRLFVIAGDAPQTRLARQSDDFGIYAVVADQVAQVEDHLTLAEILEGVFECRDIVVKVGDHAHLHSTTIFAVPSPVGVVLRDHS